MSYGASQVSETKKNHWKLAKVPLNKKKISGSANTILTSTSVASFSTAAAAATSTSTYYFYCYYCYHYFNNYDHHLTAKAIARTNS